MSRLRTLLDVLTRQGERELAQEVSDELATHLDLLTEEYVAAGMTPSEARAAARARFGDYRRIRTEGLKVRRGTVRRLRRRYLIDDFLTDVRFALRGLRRRPGFAWVSVLTLAVGIGATSAVLAVADAALFRPLPFADPDRVVVLNEDNPAPGDDVRWQVSAANLIDWRERSTSFTDIAVVAQVLQSHVDLTGIDEPLRVPIARVTPAFFDVLGVGPALGRRLLPDDDAPDAAPAVVLSHGVWQDAFGGDDAVLDRTVRLNGEPHTVVGVMPPDFGVGVAGGPHFLWLPGALPAERRGDRRQRMYRAVARLRDGVTVEQARAELAALAAALAQEYPDENQWEGRPWGADLVTAREYLVENTIRPSLLVVGGAVGIVLLIAWLNVTNLLVARMSARRREVAVRCAIGAGRSRMARQILTEALVISLLGGAMGMMLARWLADVFTLVVVGDLPVLSETSILGWTAALTLGTCLVTALACGALPAWTATRGDTDEVLKGGAGPSRGRGRLGSVLVAVEISLAIVLVIGMGLMVDTMRRLSEIPLGFDAEGVEVLRASLDRGTYTESGEGGRLVIRPERTDLVATMLERVRALPGVEAAAASTAIPLTLDMGGVMVNLPDSDRQPLPRWPQYEGRDVHAFPNLSAVTPGFFDALGIRVLRGRGFTAEDGPGSPLVTVVNQAWVDEFASGDPIGTVLQIRDGTTWRGVEIVGVVDNVLRLYPRYRFARQFTGTGPGLYLPQAQPADAYTARAAPLSVAFFVRHTGRAEAVRAALPDLFRQLDRSSPITLAKSMRDLADDNLADRRGHLRIVASLAAIAVFLALVGVYGVVSFQVTQRTREIGIRMALGARANGVVRMIVGAGARLAVSGALLGVAGALATTRLLRNWLYEVSPTDPTVFAAAPVVIVAVAILACWIPARLASRIDPVASLQTD